MNSEVFTPNSSHRSSEAVEVIVVEKQSSTRPLKFLAALKTGTLTAFVLGHLSKVVCRAKHLQREIVCPSGIEDRFVYTVHYNKDNVFLQGKRSGHYKRFVLPENHFEDS